MFCLLRYTFLYWLIWIAHYSNEIRPFCFATYKQFKTLFQPLNYLFCFLLCNTLYFGLYCKM